jgi:hypothetical protein
MAWRPFALRQWLVRSRAAWSTGRFPSGVAAFSGRSPSSQPIPRTPIPRSQPGIQALRPDVPLDGLHFQSLLVAAFERNGLPILVSAGVRPPDGYGADDTRRGSALDGRGVEVAPQPRAGADVTKRLMQDAATNKAGSGPWLSIDRADAGHRSGLGIRGGASSTLGAGLVMASAMHPRCGPVNGRWRHTSVARGAAHGTPVRTSPLSGGRPRLRGSTVMHAMMPGPKHQTSQPARMGKRRR